MKRKRKLNVQLILLTLCIAIPVMAVIAFFSVRNNRMQRNELLSENQAMVQGQLSQIDSRLDLLENALAYMSVDDAQIRQIAEAKTQDTQFWLNNNILAQRLRGQTAIMGGDFTTFLYFPKQDLFYNDAADPAAANAIREIADQFLAEGETQSSPAADPIPGNWSRLACGENSYLYILLPYSDYFTGAWIPFRQLLDGFSQSDTERYFITDPTGRVLNEPDGIWLDPEVPILALDQTEWYPVAASSSQADFRIVKLLRKDVLDAQLLRVGTNILIVAAIFVLLLIAYMVFLNIWILRPVRHLQNSMEIIRSGNLEHRISPPASASEEFRNMADEFNHLMDSIQELKISIYESELEQKEVRLAYLSRQIQPHFILNSLNTLYNHTDGDAAITKEMIKLISSYYRYVVNVNSPYVMLGQELDHIAHYLSLQTLRYPELFTYAIVCEEPLRSMQVPPFIIESFVGNIFKHGFIPGTQNQIRVEVQQEMEAPGTMAKRVVIRIEDNGNGFSEDSLDAIQDFLENKIVSEELGVGIRNSIERLQLIYQERCAIRIYNKTDHGAVVELCIPYETILKG